LARAKPPFALPLVKSSPFMQAPISSVLAIYAVP
jgi:hypothetical protein